MLSTPTRRKPDIFVEAVVARLAEEHGWQRPAIHGSNLVRHAVGREQPWNCNLLAWGSYVSAEVLEICDVGITVCLALIVQNGILLLDNSSTGERALSILPPHHLVVARREQLMEDLPVAMRAARRLDSSMVSLNTSPSRTEEIKRVLVLGAYGPKTLTVVVLDD